MKQLFIFTFILFCSAVFGQKKMTEIEWDKLASTDKSLLPNYGHLPKTWEEKSADKEFIKTILKNNTTNKNGSKLLINLGFDYLNKGDLKPAMLSFNQAYLLDSTNTDIYWGYGSVYMALFNFDKAIHQYQEGLALNPKNTHILADYGIYFLGQCFARTFAVDTIGASQQLDLAITYLQKAYQIDPIDSNTCFKVSMCYYYKHDCDNAWKYYDIREQISRQPINKKYTNDLRKKCKRTK